MRVDIYELLFINCCMNILLIYSLYIHIYIYVCICIYITHTIHTWSARPRYEYHDCREDTQTTAGPCCDQSRTTLKQVWGSDPKPLLNLLPSKSKPIEGLRCHHPAFAETTEVNSSETAVTPQCPNQCQPNRIEQVATEQQRTSQCRTPAAAWPSVAGYFVSIIIHSGNPAC